MRIVLLVSAFNGLSQRAWCALRADGHDVTVELAEPAATMTERVDRAEPELVLAPFLTHRVPAELWQRHRTVIVHPGPVGDRGPSSLDWAIVGREPVWGVTALQAVEEMDAGPIWASRTFELIDSPRKSDLYAGPVADAAMECIRETVALAADPAFQPAPQDTVERPVSGACERPYLRQPERFTGWDASADDIVRAVRAADGAPGLLTELAGVPVLAFDAIAGPPDVDAPPGSVVAQQDGAVLVGAGTGSVWIGQLRYRPAAGQRGLKLPAAMVLGLDVPDYAVPLDGAIDGRSAARQIRYRRDGAIGELTFDCYNGALSTAQCRRLLTALRHAVKQDTAVLVLRGGWTSFCNGIHLGVIEAATSPAGEAWANIRAINAVCRELVSCTTQVTVAAVTGSAGAGGAMLALGADRVLARDGVVLNPYYDMGLHGSELHTYSLPRRVGGEAATRLLASKEPVDAAGALSLGLLDGVGPRLPVEYDLWVASVAADLAGDAGALLGAKRDRLAADAAVLPLDAYEAAELAEMAQDMFADRNGFAGKRAAFIHKRPAPALAIAAA